MNPDKTPRITWILLVAILFFAFWLRLPLVGKDLPFFYNEDEAHHFNRTINMVKTGDLNPHYFHKPSLHFYLRIPVVATAFFWNVGKGNIKSIQEIKTGDPFGLKGYSLTASHPGIVKWNRMYSLGISLLTIVFTFLIAQNLFGGSFAGLLAAFVVGISPGVIADSATIGVDVVMSLFVVLATYLTVRLESHFSLKALALASLVAGLAVSTKYNAWPIALMPLIAILLYGRISFSSLLIALKLPAIGFLLGSPFILAELPLFLDHAAYEIWHYKIAGHTGHTGEPGFAQSIFFYNWLTENGLGISLLALGLLGSLLFLLRFNKKFIIYLSFPIIYFLFMSSQRANFTRNMIVLVPFLSVMAAGFLWIMAGKIRHNIKRLILIAVTPLLVLQPLRLSLAERANASNNSQESRVELGAWIATRMTSLSDIALSGNLNLPPQNYGLSGVTRIDESKASPATLFLLGFDYLIVGPQFAPRDNELKFLHLDKYIAGEKEYGRVVKDPEIKIFKFNENAISDLDDSIKLPIPTCNTNEGFCWINSRISRVDFNISKIRVIDDLAEIDLELMSPWPNQAITFKIADWTNTYDFLDLKAGQWQKFTLSMPFDRLMLAPSLRVLIKQIHSPLTQKISKDSRRLGVAIKGSSLLIKKEG